MSDDYRGRDVAAIYFLIRCSWCWAETKSTEAIHVGEESFCSPKCKLAFYAEPPSAA